MKKLILALIITAPSLQPLYAAPTEGVQAAVAAGIHGTVQIAKADFNPTDRAIGTQIGSGTPIYPGDEITTGPDSGLQVILLDQTVITLGQNSRMAVDEMIFDPTSGTGKLAVDVKDGSFRFLSGKIAQANPDNVSVKVPLASVGIRGTIFGGGPAETGGKASDGYFVMLLGPGAANNTSAKNGAIGVTSQNVTQEVSRTGWAIDLFPNQPPSAPHMATPQQQQTMGKIATSAPPPTPPQQKQGQSQQPNTATSSTALAASAPLASLVGASASTSAGQGAAGVMTSLNLPPAPAPLVNMTSLVSSGQQQSSASSGATSSLTSQSVTIMAPDLSFGLDPNVSATIGSSSLSYQGGYYAVTASLTNGTLTTHQDGDIIIGSYLNGLFKYVNNVGTNFASDPGAMSFAIGPTLANSAVPTSGSATYSLSSSTAPIWANGSGSGSLTSASLSVAFGSTPVMSAQVNVSMTGDSTYTIAVSNVSADSGYNSSVSGSRGQFSGYTNSVTAGSGSSKACASSCSGFIYLSLHGTGASAASMAYMVYGGSAANSLSGAAVLRKN